jgi:hypothetical protein
MAVMMVVLVLIGTALDLTPTILIFAPVMLPIAVKAGIDPVYFGLMFVLNGAIGLITPPVGTVLNVVAGVGRMSMHSVIKGVNPFLATYVVLLALFVMFPADRHRCPCSGCADFPFFNLFSNWRLHECFVVPLATLSAATLVASMGAALAQDIKPRLIRFGYGLNEQSNQGRAVKLFADEVEKLSGGKMKIRAVGAAALGPDTQMQQALIGGAQEMMVGSTATLVGITKEMALWDTPFLFNSAKEADAVLDGPIGQKVMDKLQEKGLVGLVYWENGFRNMTNSKRPVAKMEDLVASSCGSCRTTCSWKPSRRWAPTPFPCRSPSCSARWRPRPWTARRTRTTPSCPASSIEVQKYLSVTNHVYSPWIVLVSKKWWDQLSKAEQKVLMDAAKVSREFERKDTRAEAGRACPT